MSGSTGSSGGSAGGSTGSGGGPAGGSTGSGGEGTSAFFPYAVDWRLAALWLPFGLVPWRDGITVTADGRFEVRFGFFRCETALDNIDEAHITRDYRWWTAVGVRLSFVDDGLTFGTNNRAGVCVHFRSNVPSRLSPRRGHSALTVTVANLQGLVDQLTGAPAGG